MGFGSYDESEQQQHEMDDSEDAAVTVHEHEYDGEVTVENGGSTEDLLGQLQDIKDNADD